MIITPFNTKMLKKKNQYSKLKISIIIFKLKKTTKIIINKTKNKLLKVQKTITCLLI